MALPSRRRLLASSPPAAEWRIRSLRRGRFERFGCLDVVRANPHCVVAVLRECSVPLEDACTYAVSREEYPSSNTLEYFTTHHSQYPLSLEAWPPPPDAAPDRSLGTGTSNSDRIDAVYFSCAAYAVTGTARTISEPLPGPGPGYRTGSNRRASPPDPASRRSR